MALTQVSSAGIKNAEVKTEDILDANVTTAKVADNAITGTKVADNLDIPDNNKIRFGTGNDLELYHDGTQSQITESGTGLLYINSNVAVIRNSSGNENQITAEANGSVGLYYDNSKKLNTEADGITVTGNIGIGGDAPNYQVHATTSIGVGAHGFNQQLTIDNDGIQSLVLGTGYTTLNLNQLGGNVDIANDSSKLRLGTGNDLQIYHDGSNSFITDAGTGSLKLATNELQLLNAAGNEYYLSGIENAATSLFYDNSKKLETTSAGVSFSGDTFMPDGESAHYGTGNDMYMGHSGSYSYIEDTSGDFRIHSNGLKLQSFTSGEKYIVCTHNGAVDLYYDNVLKFFTQSTGAALHNGSGNHRFLIHNSDYIQCGHSNNGLRLYNTSVNSEIQHTSTSGSFSIRGNALQLTSYTGTENYLVANKDGAVELYHDGTKMFQTTVNGAQCKRVSGGPTMFDVVGAEGEDAELRLTSDDGDDHPDYWRSRVSASSNTYNVESYAPGTWTTYQTINTSGAVTKPKQPSASAYFSGSDSGSSGGKISGAYGLPSTTRWNIGSHFNTSTGKFTCPVAGKYIVTCSGNLNLSNLSVSDAFNITTRKNGTSIQHNYDICHNAGWQYLAFTNIIDCAANDYLQVYFSSSGNKTFGFDNSSSWNQLTFTLFL